MSMDGIRRVLAIGAHFDDIELGAGGTVARHVRQGDEVTMLVLTDSAYYDYDGTLIRSAEIANKEGKAAARLLGVNNLISTGLETKSLQYGYQLIAVINEVVDTQCIDVIYTHWDKDVHQDHSSIGRATLSAGRHVKNILMYRSNWYQTTTEFRGSYYVNITDYMDIKIKAVKANENEYKKFGDQWIEFFVNENLNMGQRIGVKYAEAFEVVKVLV